MSAFEKTIRSPLATFAAAVITAIALAMLLAIPWKNRLAEARATVDQARH